MKQKHSLNIADLQINVVTEAPAEDVEKISGMLDRKMREIYLASRCPKTEAALLCALDFCAERLALQEQIAALEEREEKYAIVLENFKVRTADQAAELDRLRAENAALQALLLRCGAPVTDLSGEGIALDPVSPQEFLEQVAEAQTEKAEDAPAPAPATDDATADAPAPGDKPRKGRNAMGSMFDLLSFDDVD